MHRETKRLTVASKEDREEEESFDEKSTILDDDSVLPMIQCDIFQAHSSLI